MGILSLIIVIFVICPKDQSSYIAAQIDKQKLLKETHGERIIFVGGSNLALGLDSKKIESCSNKKVINLGLHAGIGLKFMLSDVEPLLHEGDTVIIIPEYALFTKDMFNGNETLAELTLKYYPEGLAQLDGSQFINLLKNAPKVIRLTLLDEGLRGLRADKVPDNAFQRGKFNEHGDAIGHLTMKSKYIAITDIGEITGKAAEIGEAIKALNDFNMKVSNRGCKCIFVYPVLKENVFRINEDKIKWIDSELRKQLDIPILGSPYDFRFEDNLFFDTNYHLNKIGREKRTELVTKLMGY
jgi:hypothetical protein